MREGIAARGHEVDLEQPLGHPSHPLDDSSLIAKLIDCAGRARVPLLPGRARELTAALLAIDARASAQGAWAD